MTTYLVFELMTVYDVAYPLVFWNMTLGLYFKQAERQHKTFDNSQRNTPHFLI